MRELPDIVACRERLTARVEGATLIRVQITSPSLVRTAEPPIEAALGRAVRSVAADGKADRDRARRGLFLALHLMIAGRLAGSRRRARSSAPR